MSTEGTVAKKAPRKRRKRIKPVEKDGKLVTPVTKVPAAHINWAPSCPCCRVRVCSECDEPQSHLLDSCRLCGKHETLGDVIRCPKTRVRSTRNGVQHCKCLHCGHTWMHALPVP